jgi:Zn finger protein HypA/HybF involved in hydrogenase expression
MKKTVLYHVPILVFCTDCKKEWYTEEIPANCPECDGVVGCVVCNCRSCRKDLAYATPGLKCEFCGSTDLIRDTDPRFSFNFGK